MRLAPHRMFVRFDLHDAGAHRGRCRATNAQYVQIILGLAISEIDQKPKWQSIFNLGLAVSILQLSAKQSITKLFRGIMDVWN